MFKCILRLFNQSSQSKRWHCSRSCRRLRYRRRLQCRRSMRLRVTLCHSMMVPMPSLSDRVKISTPRSYIVERLTETARAGPPHTLRATWSREQSCQAPTLLMPPCVWTSNKRSTKRKMKKSSVAPRHHAKDAENDESARSHASSGHSTILVFNSGPARYSLVARAEPSLGVHNYGHVNFGLLVLAHQLGSLFWTSKSQYCVIGIRFDSCNCCPIGDKLIFLNK